MAVNERTQANNKFRETILNQVMEFLKSKKGGEQWVRQVSSNAFGFPFVNALGDEEVIKITIAVPSGSRDGDLYDLDGEADAYEMKCKEKAEREAEAKKKKEKKIEADKKRREQAQALKLKREQENK